MRLDQFKWKGLFLSVDPSKCLNVPFSFSSLKFQTLAMIDSSASTSFIDEDFKKLNKIPVVKKLYPGPVEVKDGRPLKTSYS